MNLLEETVHAITASGNTPSQIVFIGSLVSGYACTWEQFIILADVEYNEGYPSQQVANDLVIVFENGQQLCRHEYDGSERWIHTLEYKPFAQTKTITKLVEHDDYSGWLITLEELNRENGYD